MKLGQEHVPAGEDEVIRQIVALQVTMMKATDPARRGQHPKQHGCVEAEFVVRGDVPTEYRIGLFQAAAGFKSKVRFSNGLHADDTQPDARGMAIKVLGVTGPRAREHDDRDEQDFVLADSPAFFAPDAKATLAFLAALAAVPTDADAMKKFADLDPGTARRFAAALKPPPASPLVTPYWSQLPYKLGDRAVQYTVTPAAESGPGRVRPAAPDSLRAALVEQLTVDKKPAVFELCIIPQTDPVQMPVEDPTVPWESTAVPVATITIEPQTFDTPERMRECESASFDPWTALAEHRPLGGINRARKAVYPASVAVRRQARGH